MTSPTSATPPVPMLPESSGLMQRMNAFLDRYVLPFPVKYLTNRLTILATLCLLIPLLLFSDLAHQEFVNSVNSYLNVMSVVVSSTVLLYATLSEARDRAAAQRREEIAAEHQKAVDRRSQVDHELIKMIHNHLDDIYKEITEHINVSLENIESSLVDRLERIQEEDRSHMQDTYSAIKASADAHREELSELAELVTALRNGLIGPSNLPQ